MGKAKPRYTYAAYLGEDGKYWGFVIEDPRLKVPGISEDHALRHIEAAHNELLQDERHIETLARQQEEGKKWQTN